MERLQEELQALLDGLPDEDEIHHRLDSLVSVYPFNEYEYIISTRIEVKASRAVDAKVDGPLYVKALSSDSRKEFWMNFQQIKPDCCDVFVWISVWRDIIRYWVLSSQEVEMNPHYSKGQHRGNVGEGQLHIRHDNIGDFSAYEVKPNKLEGKFMRHLSGKFGARKTRPCPLGCLGPIPDG